MDNHTIIIGGGLAGLAAAASLATRGVNVTLLESRPRLGGRASSFTDKTTGERIDNCQHVSMGCCTNFRHFCDTVGISHLFRCETELNFIGPDGEINRFAASLWPAPFHLLSAFRKLSYLSRDDLKSLSRGLRELVRTKDSEHLTMPFREWLRERKQTPGVVENVWNVVLTSALSESLDRIDVTHARKVFVDGFLTNRRGWTVQIPTVPLDDLYGRVKHWLVDRGAEIRLQTGVTNLVVEDNTVIAVQLQNGEQLDAEQVIVAVPHHRVLSLLPESLQSHAAFGGISQLEPAPISSAHLWFDRPITNLPHAVFVGKLSQWMFNRGALHTVDVRHRDPDESDRSNTGYYYQVVVSASRHLSDLTQAQIIDEIVRELTQVWPKTGDAELLHARVVTEHRAVFSVTPGIDGLRPAQQTPVPNLQLAGDFTKTGWPATMEGAIRSGYLAAENVLGCLGRAESLIQPDLPVSFLSKILLGL